MYYSDHDYAVMHQSEYDVMAEFSSTSTYDYDSTTNETADFFLGFRDREEERRRRNLLLGAAALGTAGVGAYLFRNQIGDAFNAGLRHVGSQLGAGMGVDNIRDMVREQTHMAALNLLNDPQATEIYKKRINLGDFGKVKKSGKIKAYNPFVIDPDRGFYYGTLPKD